ncbi:transcription antitermination factor NusB [Azotosporobacter soli]|uniref:transcription antitermination factor NusB n=1 Tax=Azotosporobacter soli TaxID=3055040 RepID=UPI0031FF141A
MSRRRARELALQVLFQLDFQKIDAEIALELLCSEEGGPSDKVQKHALHLIQGVLEQQASVDGLISSVATDWKIERMPGVDRNIARIAVYEMRFDAEHLAVGIIINEAVELAKAFGTDESSRFINGILGALLKANTPANPI